MPGLRAGRCYSKVKRAYTRTSKFKKHSFIKVRPASKITRFDMGDLKKKFPNKVSLVTSQAIQIRHNAIEATRLVVNRLLNKVLGKEYFLKIRVYPHHILRENKMLTGAGADRMQQGMQRAFGKPISVAARVGKGQKIFTVSVGDKNLEIAKRALKNAKPRLPGKYTIEVEKA